LWNPTAAPRQPVLVVAAYSALLLVALLRQDINQHPQLLIPLDINTSPQAMVSSAAAR